MVRSVNFVVNNAPNGLEMLRTENVVDAEEKAFLKI